MDLPDDRIDSVAMPLFVGGWIRRDPEAKCWRIRSESHRTWANEALSDPRRFREKSCEKILRETMMDSFPVRKE